jgi:hypothetical protein
MLRQLRVLTEEEEGVRLKNTGCDTGVRQLTLSRSPYICVYVNGYMRYTRACGHIRESSAARFLLVTVTVSCVSQLMCVTVSYV